MNRPTQITFKRQPACSQLVHICGEKLIVRTARPLCLVQRGTRILQQRLAIVTIDRKQTYADTRSREELMTRKIERELQHLRKRTDGFDHVFRAVDLSS